MEKKIGVIDLIEEIRIAIKENNKSSLHSLLTSWFDLLEGNSLSISRSQNDESIIILENDKFISDLILYAVKEKYEVLFQRINSTLAHRINESILINLYEDVSYAVIDYLRDELKIDISKDFEEKYFDFTKMLGTARINEILYLAKKEKFEKVLTWTIIEEFEIYFLNDYTKVFNLFNAIKKRRGQPIKYTAADHLRLDELMDEGLKKKVAAGRLLSEKGLPQKNIDSLLKIHRERLPRRTLAKIKRQENGN